MKRLTLCAVVALAGCGQSPPDLKPDPVEKTVIEQVKVPDYNKIIRDDAAAARKQREEIARSRKAN